MSLLRSFTLSVALALTCVLATPTFAEEPAPPTRLVVHEWGVLGIGTLNGKPLLGATDSFLNSLPDFVLQNEHVSPSVFTESPRNLIIRKPVIHLYGEEGQKVEITVEVANGMPIVYYPKPELTTNVITTVDASGRHGNLKHTKSMTWKFSLSKRDPGSLLKAPPEHWWNATRNIPSDYVVMDDGGAGERFLFYEGTTVEQPRVTATVSADSITVINRDPAESAPVILIINDHGIRSGVYIESIASRATEKLTADRLKPWDEETLIANCRKQWVACGMTPEEAAGIVETWRHELLNSPGFLLISRIPDPIYQQIFPIKVKPEPAELVRVCFIFDSLPGQNDRKHWLPSLAKKGRATIAQLSDADFKTRLGAHAKLVALGEVMTPWIQEVLDDTAADAQSQMAAGTLQKTLTESAVCSHAAPKVVPLRWSGGPVRPGVIPLIEVPVGKP